MIGKIFFIATLAVAASKPSIAPAALVAPGSLVTSAAIVAAPAPIVTASSSQYIARNFNEAYPVISAPYLAPAARLIAPSPYVAAAAPISYYSPSAPLVALG
ncbi:unnamed protein product [Leptidea sinapis]|uniref:Uncharacterized protein n=1 Tax=Leptidea sinapis TaxID=189913 RepID=A0A5E4QVS7_9NEOP|nr:unnamed protein product [Leptidea sinapis]